MRPRPRRPWLVPLFGLLAAGCTPGTASVAGRVTVDGQPANGGMVVVTGPDGKSRSGHIGPDGAFAVADVAIGPAKVAVRSDPMAASRAASKAAPPMPGMPAGPAAVPLTLIPAKYSNPDTSGLSTTLAGGSNQYDIPLAGR